MTKRKARETAKAKDKTPRWNAVGKYNLADLNEEQAKAKSETVYQAWKQFQEGAESVAPVDRPRYYKI